MQFQTIGRKDLIYQDQKEKQDIAQKRMPLKCISNIETTAYTKRWVGEQTNTIINYCEFL